MPHYSTFTFIDYSEEKSTVTLPNRPITALYLPDFLTHFGNMRVALEGITTGNIHKESWVGDNTLLTNESPSNAWAQREIKWLVRYRGDTRQKLYQLEIPTADLGSVALLPDSDFADLTDTPMVNFLNAFEVLVRAPDDPTEEVTVESVQVVGRNL